MNNLKISTTKHTTRTTKPRIERIVGIIRFILTLAIEESFKINKLGRIKEIELAAVDPTILNI